MFRIILVVNGLVTFTARVPPVSDDTWVDSECTIKVYSVVKFSGVFPHIRDFKPLNPADLTSSFANSIDPDETAV